MVTSPAIVLDRASPTRVGVILQREEEELDPLAAPPAVGCCSALFVARGLDNESSPVASNNPYTRAASQQRPGAKKERKRHEKYSIDHSSLGGHACGPGGACRRRGAGNRI